MKIVILLVIVLLICINYKKVESYVVVKCNKETIPNEMYEYQKTCKNDNYGFIPRSLYPDLVKLNNNHSKKLINDFQNNGGDKVFRKIPKKGNVKYIHLIKNGSKQPESANYPIIYKLIKNIKNLENASIACLNKKSKTKVHNKFDKNLFRAHIPLQIPDGKCGICVEKQCRSWKKKDFLLIDENLMHQVWNNSDENRVVLLLDVKQVKFDRS